VERPASPLVACRHQSTSKQAVRAMGLRAKFNFAFLAAFIIGFALAGFALQRLFVENAREQVVQNARIMMSAADAIRHFTTVRSPRSPLN
jgi:hypothetical protein